MRTLKFSIAWDLKFCAPRKIFQKKTKKKTEKKEKRKPIERGRGVVSRFFGKSFWLYFRTKNLLPKTRSAWPLHHLVAGFGNPLACFAFFIFWPLYGWQIVKECCLDSKGYLFNHCLKKSGNCLVKNGERRKRQGYAVDGNCFGGILLRAVTKRHTEACIVWCDGM